LEEEVVSRFREWLREDNPYWDITTEALIPRGVIVEAVILARTRAVTACLEEAVSILKNYGLEVLENIGDGVVVEPGTVLLRIRGDARKILVIERTLLNLLMHCMGVATITHDIVERVKRINSRVRIAATRKTMPGLRYFDKKAVLIGGGDTHRLGLSDMVLIKDNHLKIIGSVREAIRIAREKTSFSKKVEVEVESLEEAIEAVEAGADIVMLDNMRPEEVERVLEELRRRNLRDKVLIEVSGGIRPDNIEEYARLDVDIISMGWITHSAPAVDLSLEITRVYKHKR
jgi:nicotinate-nucleotide pyrophosphorylase (carboxylating)